MITALHIQNCNLDSGASMTVTGLAREMWKGLIWSLAGEQDLKSLRPLHPCVLN